MSVDGFSVKVQEQIERLPASMRQLLDAELAAGGEVTSLEFGRGPDRGKVALILKHPFRTDRAKAPKDLGYRERLDGDPQVFEYSTADEMFSLVTAKFKPMKFEKIIGPPNPTQEHIERMNKRVAELEAAALERRAAAEKIAASIPRRGEPSPPPARDPNRSEPAKRFLASMNINYEMWHDGIGYDLDALKQVPDSEIGAIESILIEHRPRDWRDVEALAQIDSALARAEIEKSLHSSDNDVRRVAMKYAGDKLDSTKREQLLVRSLENDVIFGGLTQALDEVEEFHPPAVMDALFRGALRRDGEAAVHFAAMLFYLHGKADEPFDWNHRPFFLKFHATDRAEREKLFRELCERIGVDPGKYVR